MKPATQLDFSSLHGPKPFEPLKAGGWGWAWMAAGVVTAVVCFVVWLWRRRRRGIRGIAEDPLNARWLRLMMSLRNEWEGMGEEGKQRLARDAIYTAWHRFLGYSVDDKTPAELRETVPERDRTVAPEANDDDVWREWRELLDEWERLHYTSTRDGAIWEPFRRRLLHALQRLDALTERRRSIEGKSGRG